MKSACFCTKLLSDHHQSTQGAQNHYHYHFLHFFKFVIRNLINFRPQTLLHILKVSVFMHQKDKNEDKEGSLSGELKSVFSRLHFPIELVTENWKINA